MKWETSKVLSCCVCLLFQDVLCVPEKDEILADITSRLWFTYRKNFQPIGESQRVLNLDLTVQGLHLIINLDSLFSFTDGLLMDVMLQVALGPLQTLAGAACFDVDRWFLGRPWSAGT